MKKSNQTKKLIQKPLNKKPQPKPQKLIEKPVDPDSQITESDVTQAVN